MYAICTTRQSEERHKRNKKIAMATLYNLCFALCQRCNYLQKENALLLTTNNINKEALNTERNFGTTCCARTGNRILEEAQRKNADIIENVISEAIEKSWLIIASIDD